MNVHSNVAPMAHAFDPAEWLDSFKNTGGWWIVTADRVSLGGYLDGNLEGEQRASLMLSELRRNAGNLATVKALLVSQAMEA